MKRLNQQIVPTYYAEIEIHTVSELIIGEEQHQSRFPDVAVYEKEARQPLALAPVTVTPVSEQRLAVERTEEKLRSVRITLRETGELVTMVEILSLGNKRGDGLTAYREKRQQILHSDVHLVEIDLLRGGIRPRWELEKPKIREEYVVLVNRVNTTRLSDIWAVALNDSLPTIPIPLLYPDPDATLDLTEVIQSIYRDYRYDVVLNYSHEVPPPALRPEMAHWWKQQQSQLNKNGTS